MNTPTREQAARQAARYAVTEFKDPALRSWFGYEDELAAQWLQDSAFGCAVDYAIAQVMIRIRHNRGMQAVAAEHPAGVAVVVGRIVGEWVAGHTTIDRELETWG